MELKPGYKLTEVGMIPHDWDVKLLSTVAAIRTGIAKNANIAVSDPLLVHYLRVANVQDGFLDLSEMSQIQINRNDLKRYSVLPGDVLMNEGGDLDQLGRGAMWCGEFNPCVHQNHVFVVRCGSALSPQFLDIWTSSNSARRYFLVAGKQTTNLASINKTALGLLPVLLPPPAEQRAIAGALSDVDALIGALDQLIAKKRDLKQAAMQQLLTGHQRLPGFSGEWEMKKLGDVATIRDGTHQTPKYVASGIPFFSVEHVTSGDFENTKFISEEEHRFLTRSFKIEKGDILMTRIGSIGDCKLIDWEVDASFYVSLALLKIHPDYSAAYITHYSNSAAFKKEVDLHSLQSAIPKKINLGPISNVRIEMPPLAEQTAIAEVLSDMDAELAALEQKRDKTRLLKQGMMQELLTGRTRLL